MERLLAAEAGLQTKQRDTTANTEDNLVQGQLDALVCAVLAI